MSDDTEEGAGLGHRSHRPSRVALLRERMRAILREHDRDVDLETIRAETSGGNSLQSIVDDDRSERV